MNQERDCIYEQIYGGHTLSNSPVLTQAFLMPSLPPMLEEYKIMNGLKWEAVIL